VRDEEGIKKPLDCPFKSNYNACRDDFYKHPLLRRQHPILREHFADESVDLIYLDPPFNSNKCETLLVLAVHSLELSMTVDHSIREGYEHKRPLFSSLPH